MEVLQGEFTLKFKIDAATFINYYSSIFTKAALSRITLYGHQNELCKIERRQKCCCGLFISELNGNGLSCERKTKCDIALQTLYV